MLKRNFIAISLIVALNVAVSFMVSTYMTTSTVKSDPVVPAQSFGAAVTATALQSTSSTSFANLSGMTLTTPPLRGGDLIILFSAESFTTGGAGLTVRCLVDGVPAQPGEVTLDSDGAEAHAMNFHAPNVGIGMRTVTIQWRRTGAAGSIFVNERTLAAINVFN
jgi:hypothetical protein